MTQNNLRTYPQELDPETIKQFLEHRQQHLAFETEQLRLEEKRLDLDAKLVERSMEINAAFLRAQPGQKHKSTIIKAISYSLRFSLFSLALLGGWSRLGKRSLY